MRLMVPLVAAVVLHAPTASAQDRASAEGRLLAANEVAATERAFDAFTAEHGFTRGFVEFAAPDGLLFRPDPVNARAYLLSRDPSNDTQLRWGPYRVGVADSGDLAWDTGPWTYGDDAAHGWFFTIWERQADGLWRWALDHGSGSTPHHVPVPAPQDVIVDPAATGAPAAGSDPWTEVQAMDLRLNQRLVGDGRDTAYADVAAVDLWASTEDAGPAMTAEAARAALLARPEYEGFEPIGGRASAAGDLAYSYGHVRWTDAGTARRGHYIRVWRRDVSGAQGWRLVYDQLSPAPPPAS